MPQEVVSLHVVAPGCSALAAALRERVGGYAQVRPHTALPPSRELGRLDLLVVQLDSTIAPDPALMSPFIGQHEIWLAYADGRVSARWLETSGWPHVHFVHCDTLDREAGCRPLAASLAQYLAGIVPGNIAGLVLEKEPRLADVEDLVRAVCEHPWDVRRPTQLAKTARRSLAATKRVVQALGFGRIEHFVTYVRWVACEQLVMAKHLRPVFAEQLMGIADRSNLRRQLARMRGGSPGALKRLKGIAEIVACVILLWTDVACRQKAEGQASSSGNATAPLTDSAVVLTVTGAMVRRGDLVLTIHATGQVRAERQLSLRGEIQGTVEAVHVRPGWRVDSGTVLVELDSRPFDLAVREAEAQLSDANVRYRDILLGDDTTALAPAALERRRNARLRAGIDGMQARLERAHLDRERATLKAPFAGTIDQVQVVVGQRVGPGDPIAAIVDLRSLLVEASVLEHDLPLIHRGAAASVSVAAAARPSPARVIAVLPLVDTTTRSGRALVRVQTADALLRPGMYADVELEATRLPHRVIVPAPAIIERDGRPLVFRYSGGKAEWVYVAPGRSNGRETEILADSTTARPVLVIGDTVLVEGHLTLTHGAAVRVSLPQRLRSN